MPRLAEIGHLVAVGAVQAGLGLVVGAFLGRLYRASREPYLGFWALEWIVMSLMSAIGILALASNPLVMPGLAIGAAAVLVGYMQPTALGLAALSLARKGAGRRDLVTFAAAAMGCGLVLSTLAGVLDVSVPTRILIAVVPSHVFSVAANICFAWAYARNAPRARTTAGRLVVGFSVVYAAHLLAVTASWAGWELYASPTVPAVVGLLLPMGITSGIALAVLQEAEESAQRLRASEANNRALLAALPDMLLVLDRDGVYRDYLPAKEFGPLVPPERFLGRRAEEVLPPELAELQKRHLEWALATGETQVFEYSLPGGDKVTHYEARLAASDAGLVISVVRDVTRRRSAEQERERLIAELERKNAELAAKNAELERFTYTVSHDLRSPLVTILGFLGFAEKAIAAGDAEQARGDLGRVRAAASKMDQLLRELLELSRVGRVAGPSEPVDLRVLAREVVTLLDAPIRARAACVRITDDLPTVRADRGRLREVLQNLVENAVRFSGKVPAPLVTIGTRGRDASGCHVVFVSDNGIGIEPVHQERVFGLFEKLDASSPGTGVGLALVRRIIEVHGGRVWVESEGRGHGATFCFTLPDGTSAAA